MNWEETIALLHEGDWQGRKMGFRRMEELLGRLGNPERKLRFLHVAGTNGKGSASAMLAGILHAAGIRTGLYISPHIREMNERWSVDGINISDERLRGLGERLREQLSGMRELPTAFELLTVLGLLYFYEEGCDAAVLEVGLGGRLDATNVIPTPDCALIMHIGLEHTAQLGDTLEKIAREKGGIIKEGGEVVLYRQRPEVERVIREICEEKGARLTVTEECRALPAEPEDGQLFSYRQYDRLRLSLLGSYQRENAVAVLDAVEVLRRKGYRISDEAVAAGLSEVRWQGRFELLCRAPLVLVDGAHNPNGAAALARSLREYLPGKRICFLLGVMEDKDYHEMLRIIAPLAERFLAAVPKNARALSKERLRDEIRSCFDGETDAFASVTEALGHGLRIVRAGEADALVCFGSLYQVSEIRAFFQNERE